MKIKWYKSYPHRLAVTFALLFAGILVSGILFYSSQYKQIKTSVFNELLVVSNIKSDQIAKWKKERLSEAAFLYKNISFTKLAYNYSINKDSASLAEIFTWLDIIKNNHKYAAVYLFDTYGNEIHHIGASDSSTFQHLENYYGSNFQNSGIFISGLYRDEDNMVYMDMVVPVRNSALSGSDIPFSYVLFKIDPDINLFPMISLWPTSAKSYETFIVAKDKDSVIYLSNLKFRPKAALSMKFHLSDSNLLAVKAVQGYEGFYEGKDYRNKKVLAITKKIPNTNWYLVAKADKSEVYESMNIRGVLTLILIILLVVSAGLSLLYLWNRHRLDTVNQLYDSELKQKALLKHFEFLTKHANDIILLTDEKGMIIDANEKAADVYGYSLEQLKWLYFNDLSAAKETDKIKLEKNSLITGIIFDSEHKRSDGSVFPVEISSRSMVFENKRYIQHIIRDISERHRHEKKIEHLNAVLMAIRNVNKLITTIRDRKQLIEETCTKLIETRGYINSWIILLGDDNKVADYASAGFGDSMEIIVDRVNQQGTTHCFRQAEKFNHPAIIRHLPDTCPDCPVASNYDGNLAIITCLRYAGKKYGCLLVTMPEGFAAETEEFHLFAEVADDIAFALYSIDLDEERTKALQEISSNREQLRLIIDNLPALISYVDADQRYVYINKTYSEFFGLDQDMVIGKKVSEIIGEAAYKNSVPYIERVLNGELVEFENNVYSKDGILHYVKLAFIPHFDKETGKPKAYFALVYDITDIKNAEREARENERRLATLMDNLPGMAYKCQNDENYTLEFVSRGCFELTGYLPDMLIDNNEQSYSRLIHPEDLQLVVDGVNIAVENRKPFFLIYRIITKDNKTKWVWEKGTGIYDESDSLLALEGLIVDITREKETEAALRESESKFREMADLLPQIIFEIDLEGNFTFVNRQGYEITGYTQEEAFNNIKALELFVPEDRERAWNNIQHLLKGNERHGNEYTAIKKDGSTFPVITYSTPIIKNGQPVGLRGFVIDITDLKIAQSKLKESEEKFREMADMLPQAVYEMDLNGNFTFINKYGYDQFGYTPKDIANEKTAIDMLCPEDRERATENIRSVLRGEKSSGNEYTAVKKDGTTFPVMIYSSAIVKNDTVVGLRGTIIDISTLKKASDEIAKLNIELEKRVKDRTAQLEDALIEIRYEINEREKTEERLRKAQEELSEALENEKELNELKSRFISMVSHEYRTPLTVILSSTELLSIYYKLQNNDEFEKNLNRIKSSIKDMVDLLENVLSLGRIESGKTTFEPTYLDIVDFCNEIIEEIKFIDNSKHEITFTYNIAERVIVNEAKLLYQIINNLLQNSVKYSPENEPIIMDLSETENDFIFTIRDHGIGISEEDQKHLFEPFFRGKNAGKISGTGLGLSIVKKCAEMLDGEIYLQSTSGQGSTFTLKLSKKTKEEFIGMVSNLRVDE